MVACGAYFTTTNVFKLMHGYALFSFQQMKEEEKPEKPPIQTTKKEKTAIDQTFETGEKIGDLVIPKINARLPIYHGTDEDEPQKAWAISQDPFCLEKMTTRFYQATGIRFSENSAEWGKAIS